MSWRFRTKIPWNICCQGRSLRTYDSRCVRPGLSVTPTMTLMKPSILEEAVGQRIWYRTILDGTQTGLGFNQLRRRQWDTKTSVQETLSSLRSGAPRKREEQRKISLILSRKSKHIAAANGTSDMDTSSHKKSFAWSESLKNQLALVWRSRDLLGVSLE